MVSAPALTPELEVRLREIRAQERYERKHESVGVLADELQMDVVAFRRLIRNLGWQRRPAKSLPSPRRLRITSVGPARRLSRAKPAADASPADVATLVERQLSAIDRILADLQGAAGAAPERDARTIASVSRTLKELMRMRAQDAPSASDNDSDMPPRNVDEFRRELARRMEAFVASQADGALSGAGERSDS